MRRVLSRFIARSHQPFFCAVINRNPGRSPGGRADNLGEELAVFRSSLVYAPQDKPLASWHIHVAYFGIATTTLISFMTGGLLVSLCYW